MEKKNEHPMKTSEDLKPLKCAPHESMDAE